MSKKITIFIIMLATSFISIGQTLSVGNNATVTISSNATYTAIVMGNNSTLIVNSGVTLTINGDVDANNGGDFYVNGVLLISGTLEANNNTGLFIDGSLEVGSVTVGNNGTLSVSGNGDVQVSGNFNSGTNTTVNVDLGGNVDIGGNMTVGGGTSSVVVDGTVTVGGNYSGPDPTGDGTMSDSSGTILGAPLPVALMTSEISITDNIVNLQWSTATEINNDRFEIFRSNDLNNWDFAGRVAGHGNSQSVINYSFTDFNAPIGQLYYQLKQIDYDGTTEIIAQHAILNTKGKGVTLFPNPVAEGEDWFLKGAGENDHIEIFNLSMQPVEKEKLVKGIYFVIVNRNAPIKLVVQ